VFQVAILFYTVWSPPEAIHGFQVAMLLYTVWSSPEAIHGFQVAILLYTVWSSPEAIHGWLCFCYTVCPRPRPSTVGYAFVIPFVPARGHPRSGVEFTATLASKAYIHGVSDWLYRVET